MRRFCYLLLVFCFFSQKSFEFWHSRLRGSLRLCLATVEGRGRERNENTFLMFGNREKRNR